METLLSLTSKRAGDWFKEELRLLGGLDHIVDKGILEVLLWQCEKSVNVKKCLLFLMFIVVKNRNMYFSQQC